MWCLFSPRRRSSRWLLLRWNRDGSSWRNTCRLVRFSHGMGLFQTTLFGPQWCLNWLVFARFEFSSLTVYVVFECTAAIAFLEKSPQQSVRCLFRPHQSFFVWKEVLVLQKASFKTYGWEGSGQSSRLTRNSPHKHMNKHYWRRLRGFVLILWSTSSYSRTSGALFECVFAHSRRA